jgi:hypothetical protein
VHVDQPGQARQPTQVELRDARGRTRVADRDDATVADHHGHVRQRLGRDAVDQAAAADRDRPAVGCVLRTLRDTGDPRGRRRRADGDGGERRDERAGEVRSERVHGGCSEARFDFEEVGVFHCRRLPAIEEARG